jgi:hypothetical protein
MNYSVMARVEEEINLRGEGARRAPTFRIMRNTPQVAAETPPLNIFSSSPLHQYS